jgi:RNA polymerase sigma-70 factor (ECF subfamily)
MGDVTDAGLLERAGQGDADAFSSLFARYQRAIYRYAVHMCGAEAGDDVVQDTFMAILRQSGRYDATRGSVASYLFGIARHMVIKTLSRDALAGHLDDEVIPANSSSEQTVLDQLTRAEAMEAVRAAIRSLPPVYREVVVLYELEEMDYARCRVRDSTPDWDSPLALASGQRSSRRQAR